MHRAIGLATLATILVGVGCASGPLPDDPATIADSDGVAAIGIGPAEGGDAAEHDRAYAAARRQLWDQLVAITGKAITDFANEALDQPTLLHPEFARRVGTSVSNVIISTMAPYRRKSRDGREWVYLRVDRTAVTDTVIRQLRHRIWSPTIEEISDVYPPLVPMYDEQLQEARLAVLVAAAIQQHKSPREPMVWTRLTIDPE